MRILLISFYGEKQLFSSSAQNTHQLASSLVSDGHEVRLVCGSQSEGDIWQDGYKLIRIPFNSPINKSMWLGKWRPNVYVDAKAKALMTEWLPDVIFVGAWGGLIDFPIRGIKFGVPVIQLVHDYSILCMRQWLIDSWGNLCSGPTTIRKCSRCINHSLGWKDQIKNGFLSIPVVGQAARYILGDYHRYNINVRSVIPESMKFMDAYRKKVTLFIAQSPTVIDKLTQFGVEKKNIKLITQYIGENKLKQYPRSNGDPGIDRPLYLVFVGRWTSLKGADLLLNAYLDANFKIPSQLWVISTTTHEDEILETNRDRLSAGKNIKVFNNLAGSAVSKQVARADVCVVPSIMMDLAPRVVLEAMAQKVPVIASSSVGNAYLIKDGQNGRIFPTGNLPALQRCLEEITRNPVLLRHWAEKLPTPISYEDWFEKIKDVFREAHRSNKNYE